MAKTTTSDVLKNGTNLLVNLLGNNTNPNAKKYNTSITLNGTPIANTNVSKKKITTNYDLSEDENNLLNYTNKNLLSGLENINVFSDEVQKNIQDQVDSYTKQGIKTLNETYTPMFRDLKADIASRFGNIDNSIFLDNLNEIEKNRTNALETLTENILAKQTELYNQEMTNRYNYLEQLATTNKNLYSNIFNLLELASQKTSG